MVSWLGFVFNLRDISHLGMVVRRDLVRLHLSNGTHSKPVTPQMGLEPTTFQLKPHNLSQDLIKLRFFKSQKEFNER